MNALFEMIDEGDLEGVKRVLRDDPELLSEEYRETTPLAWACEMEEEEIAQALLDAGANPDAASADGETALHVCAAAGAGDCVHMLLNRGANVNSPTEEGKTPLMNAAQAGSAAVIRMLLDKGADAKIADTGGRTALHWAVVGEHDDPSIARLLLQAGVNAGQRNANGDTALDYARAMKKTALEQELASHGSER